MTSFRSAHFSITHLLTAYVSRLLKNVVYTQRRGLIRGMKRRGGLGFLPEFIMPDRTAEAAFFRSLKLEDQVVYDVGAFEGLTTLWFSRQARQVVTYEPNPASYARVIENLRLNNITNVILRHVGVGAEPGSVDLAMDPLMPGAASAAPGLSSQIRSNPKACDTISVPIVRIDDDIAANDLPTPDFIKIDIEGFELMALHGCEQTLKQNKPRVYMEMHGATTQEKNDNVIAIVEFIKAMGYRSIRHIESDTSITTDNAKTAASGHLYCEH